MNRIQAKSTVTLNPTLAAFRAAYTEHAAETEREWRRRQATSAPQWRSASLIRTAEALLDCRTAAAKELGEALGRMLGSATPLILSSGLPHWCNLILDGNVYPRLLDHLWVFRFKGTHGPVTARNAVVVTEPNLPADRIPWATGIWAGQLHPYGLVVRQLPRAWRTHAPDNAHSQIFMIGAPDVIG